MKIDTLTNTSQKPNRLKLREYFLGHFEKNTSKMKLFLFSLSISVVCMTEIIGESYIHPSIYQRDLQNTMYYWYICVQTLNLAFMPKLCISLKPIIFLLCYRIILIL